MQHVFIIGSKGIPGAYGGYETFVDKLTEYHQNSSDVKYHVACKSTEFGEFEYHNAHCFKIKVPNIGPIQAIYYDVDALMYSYYYIKKYRIINPVVYILACRIGPWASFFKRKIHQLSGTVIINPDGHEWMRAKWSAPIRKYWKISERLMIKHSDLVICDSKNIKKYICENYATYNPRTTYIAYGAETKKSILDDKDPLLVTWYRENGIYEKSYYLVVGRFVPENNFEIMIKEFMMSTSERDFVIITTYNERFLNEPENKLHFKADKRIKFVGTVYSPELLKKIRENAYGYLHGHEVGGTNPSLLEALSSTNLNLLLDVGFNREVAEDCALYWNKTEGSLSNLIDKCDCESSDKIIKLGERAKKRIADEYSWQYISLQYMQVFLDT